MLYYSFSCKHFDSNDILELLWIPIIPITASLVLQISLVENLAIYKELLLILSIDTRGRSIR